MLDLSTAMSEIYVQHEGNVLLLSMGSIQGELHRLLCEAQLVLAE